jgi:hypothetical protein
MSLKQKEHMNDYLIYTKNTNTTTNTTTTTTTNTANPEKKNLNNCFKNIKIKST